MQPLFKPKKELSARQKQLMNEIKPLHTKAYMAEMKKLLLQGYCIEQAFVLTNKKIKK